MNPYQDLPENAFWKTAVAQKSMFDISGLWSPKFHIKRADNVATYGSCFAQHIGKALAARKFNWLSTEHAPQGLSADNAKRFNFDIFSARTGNIYTTSLLKQWAEWAFEVTTPADEVWCKDGRYFDPFRPQIEPNGFASLQEVVDSRNDTINAFRASVEQSQYFVFTLGLTESWRNVKGNYEYPMCPGTIAGDFIPDTHRFVNQQFNQVLNNLGQSLDLMRKHNPKLKFILTVSPVPLTATKSGQHVLTATMLSKSILRAVAGQLATNRKYVDYFPSFEIINSPVFKGTFFEPNQRQVNPYGVNFVMDSFFRCLEEKFGAYPSVGKPLSTPNADEVCEEQLLEAFGK